MLVANRMASPARWSANAIGAARRERNGSFLTGLSRKTQQPHGELAACNQFELAPGRRDKCESQSNQARTSAAAKVAGAPAMRFMVFVPLAATG